MKRTYLFILALILFQPAIIYSQSINNDEAVFIYQANHEIQGRDKIYEIQDKPFEIVVEGVDEEDNIAIFAYHNDEMFDRYSYPVSTSDTVIFAPATGLAMPHNEDRKFFLRINKELTQNYFSRGRRINKANHAIIQIKRIIDPYHLFLGKDTAYLTLFVDFNKNSFIEENEIRNIVLKIIPVVKKSQKREY